MALTPLVLAAKVVADGVEEAEAKFKKVGQAATNAGGGIKGMLSNMLSIAGGIGIANLAGDAFGFLTGAIGGTISAAAESQRIMAQVNAGLQSTHGVSGQTAQSIQDLAGKIQSLTGIDDEATEQAEAMLLTFTNISGKTFPAATQAIADYATKMAGGAIPSSQQMQDAAIKIGKALNDPIHNLDALSKSGVQFTDQQKAQIKALQESGDLLGAQNIVLQEFQKEMGGAANAAGKTFAGQMAILKGELGNVQEAVGTPLIGALNGLLQALNPLITAFANNLPGALDAAGKALKPLGDAAGMLWNAFQSGLAPALASIADAFKGMQGPGAGVSSLVSQLASGFGQMAPVVKQLGSTVGGVVVQAFQNAQPLFATIGNIVKQLAPVFMDLAAHALPLVAQLMQTVGGLAGGLLVPILGQMGGFISSTIVPIVKSLAGFFSMLFDVLAKNVLPTIQNLASQITAKLLPPLENILSKVLPVLNGLFGFLGWLLGNVIGPIIQNVIGPVLGFLISILGLLLQGVGWVMDKLGELKDHLVTALQPAIKNVSEKLGELHKWFNDKVLPVIQQVHAFFNDKILPVLQKVGGFIRDQVVAHLSSLWDIISNKVLPILGDLAGKVKDGIGKQFETFGNTVKTVFGHIGDLLGKLGELKDKFTNLKFQFPHINLPHFSIAGNFSINPPEVPHLDVQWYAKGGVFMGPQIAGVGDVPEAVIPLDRLPGILAAIPQQSGRGASGSTTVILEVDGRQLARAVLDHGASELKRYGLRIGTIS